MRPTITLINGSLGGADGNTAAVLTSMLDRLRLDARVETLHLATDRRTPDEIEGLLTASDGFVFATGTYWDSWGSPLQVFLEQVTRLEAGPAWLGKPAAVVVTVHLVGGKGVLTRLQGVLSTLGLLLPPMTGFVYSLAAHLALQHSAGHADFWHPDDLAVVAHNLLEALRGGRDWRAWPVDGGDPHRRWV